MWRWDVDKDSIIATFLIDAQIDLTNEMISDELYLIILSELAVREGSVFALKIQARTYRNQYAGKNDEWSKHEHKRMLKLKSQFALSKEGQKPTQQVLSEIAHRMLKSTEKR